MLTGSRQARRCVCSGYLGWEDDQGKHHDAVLADGGEHSTTLLTLCLASGGGPQMLKRHQGIQGQGWAVIWVVGDWRPGGGHHSEVHQAWAP